LVTTGLYKDEEAAIRAMAIEQVETKIAAYREQVHTFEEKYRHSLDEHSRLLEGKASMAEEDEWMEWQGAVVMLEAWQQALQLRGESMSLQAVKYPALNVSAATAELVKGVLALYPQAQIVPRVAPLEDEDISVEIRLPLNMEEIYQARDRVHELVIQLQEQYDVLILASAVPA
jgi:hypothetical protein